nr:signal peptide peptidase-like 2 [Tanacetum cinerariifolium]
MNSVSAIHSLSLVKYVFPIERLPEWVRWTLQNSTHSAETHGIAVGTSVGKRRSLLHYSSGYDSLVLENAEFFVHTLIHFWILDNDFSLLPLSYCIVGAASAVDMGMSSSMGGSIGYWNLFFRGAFKHKSCWNKRYCGCHYKVNNLVCHCCFLLLGSPLQVNVRMVHLTFGGHFLHRRRRVFAILSAVYHETKFAWIGQDILGIALIIIVLQIVHVPNLKAKIKLSKLKPIDGRGEIAFSEYRLIHTLSHYVMLLVSNEMFKDCQGGSRVRVVNRLRVCNFTVSFSSRGGRVYGLGIGRKRGQEDVQWVLNGAGAIDSSCWSVTAFAAWGPGPLLRACRILFLQCTQPVILPSAPSQVVKQRLLNFVRSSSTGLAFAYVAY